MPHTVASDDGDNIGEPDALSDQLFELVPDEENELESVDEIVVDGESVPDADCDIERVPHGDAVKDTDMVPHALAEADEQIVDELDGLTVPLLTDVADGLYDPDKVGEDDSVAEIVDDVESVPDTDCVMERVPHGDAV